MSRYLLPLLLLAALMTEGVQARTYRWVNEEGVTVYSQTPPPAGKAEVVKPPPPPPTGAKTLPPVQEQLERIEEQNAQRRERETKQAELGEWHGKRRANCEAARGNLQVLQGPSRRLVATPGAGYERLSEERRQELIQAARDQIEEFCTEREP